MSAQYIIGIIGGLLGIATVAGTWIWKLSSKLKELENKKPDESKAVADAVTQATFNCRQDFKRDLEEIEKNGNETKQMIKELTKWQIPGMEEKSIKAMGEMAKAVEKLITTLDNMK